MKNCFLFYLEKVLKKMGFQVILQKKQFSCNNMKFLETLEMNVFFIFSTQILPCRCMSHYKGP